MTTKALGPTKTAENENSSNNASIDKHDSFDSFLDHLSSPSVDEDAPYGAAELGVQHVNDDAVSSKAIGPDAVETGKREDTFELDGSAHSGLIDNADVESPAPTGTAVAIVDDDDDIVPPSGQQRAGRCGQWGKHRCSKFASVLLFVIGSILYLIMSVKDFHWAKTLQTLPLWLRTVDDDIAWTNYRIEEKYNASLPLLPEEEEGAIAASRSGGVRRMKRRELREHRRLEEEENQAKIARRLSKAAKKKAREVVRSAEAAQAQSSSTRKLQTPEELYYDECWTDLPQEIQDSFIALGYSETLWDEGGEVASDDFDWAELTAAQLAAAVLIGYTEEIWCADTPPIESVTTPKPVTDSPTKQPTLKPVTGSPTKQPTLKPVTESPTNKPTIKPVTGSPTKQLTVKPVSQDILLWGGLPSGSETIYATLGYDEVLWNSGGSVAVDDKTWDEMTIGERFAAYAIGFTEDSWDAIAPGEHFSAQPSSFAPLPTPSPVRITSAPVQTPSKSPTKSPTQSPSQVPSRAPSQSPSVNPTTSPIPATAQNIPSPTSPISPGVPAPVEPPPSDSISALTPAVSDPVVPASPTPMELYEEEWWRDLPPVIQDAYAVLGYNETAWDGGIETETEDMFWAELSPERQEAALVIGYNEESWDADFEPTSSPSVKPALAPAPTNTTFAGFFFVPDANTTNATEDKVDEEIPEVAVGFYDDYDWAEMPPHIQEAAGILGYDEDIWCMGGVAPSDGLFWDELSPEAQKAASLLGYSKESWDVEDLALSALIGTDDDYVFQVGGSTSDVWVSEYQILYFFAALSFVFVGILDLVRDRHIFHILMILAGVFGVISAVYVEENFYLSDVFNCVSVHLYLLESFLLYGEHKRSAISTEAPKWMKYSNISGDLAFVIGALIDVIVRPTVEFLKAILIVVLTD